MNGFLQSWTELFGGNSTRRRMITALLCFALTLVSRYTCAQTAPAVVPPPSNITFTTRLDHTAVWVGDQFHYLIIVDYPSDYEFVLDNLTRETVNMDPFQVMDVGKNLVVQKNTGRKLFVDLTLANFVTGQTSMQIPQFTLYYFRQENSRCRSGGCRKPDDYRARHRNPQHLAAAARRYPRRHYGELVGSQPLGVDCLGMGLLC